MAANRARSDLREKLRLERLLAANLRGFNRQMVRNTVREYVQTGRAFNADTMNQELIDMLAKQYDRVAPVFDRQITDILPDEIAATDREKDLIQAALNIFFASRSVEQSAIITGTNQRNIDESISEAIELSQEIPNQTRTDIGIQAGVNLNRKLTGRVTGIAALETQASAEASKGTEAQILTGQAPSVTGGSPRDVPVKKEWVTVGDERVRKQPFSHVLADSQTQNLNTAFTVGGERLRWPGDSSLGASVGNFINCRCSSVVDEDNVFAIRVKRGVLPSVDISISEQLRTSLGELI